jgi:hypothetical protein
VHHHVVVDGQLMTATSYTHVAPFSSHECPALISFGVENLGGWFGHRVIWVAIYGGIQVSQSSNCLEPHLE